ncbi:hypothetical protein EDB19DRAFT_1942126 [Suillus lakei]|nr:hypothetical protein EDB19DRAFT_1942126 [Suillus lakei]
MFTPIFIFPVQTPDYLLSFQSHHFSSITIKITIICPLDQDFEEHIDSEGIFVPEGSENAPKVLFLMKEKMRMGTTVGRSFPFPDLDELRRQIIKEYGAVFPKLNFSSPKGCQCDPSNEPSYQLEVVLREWYPINWSCELQAVQHVVTHGCINSKVCQYQYSGWTYVASLRQSIRNSNFLTQTGTTSVQGNFYERSQSAAVPRSYIYVGIGALTKLYGGRNRHGNRPSHHADFSASAQNLSIAGEDL